MDQAKAYWQKNHSQTARIIPEGGEQDHRYKLAREILALKPESVFEFGCASGRNLRVLHDTWAASPETESLRLVGLDMNLASLGGGRSAHPMVGFLEGDERLLAHMVAAGEPLYDVAFTVSVLDHVPYPEWQKIYDNLKKIARRAVFLLEPVRDAGRLEAEVEDAPPFTWYHDYVGYDRKLKLVRQLPIDHTHYSMGEEYFLMRRDLE